MHKHYSGICCCCCHGTSFSFTAQPIHELIDGPAFPLLLGMLCSKWSLNRQGRGLVRVVKGCGQGYDRVCGQRDWLWHLFKRLIMRTNDTYWCYVLCVCVWCVGDVCDVCGWVCAYQMRIRIQMKSRQHSWWSVTPKKVQLVMSRWTVDPLS